jgi:hypothetical protein
MVTVEGSVAIERSVAEVYVFLSDRANDALWRMSGRIRQYDIVPHDDGRFTVESGSHRPVGEIELTPAGGRTRVSLRFVYEPRPVIWAGASPAMRGMHRQVAALQALKTALEAPMPDDGATRSAPHDDTFLRAFSEREFVWWESWTKLLRLLSSNGGCYGVSGPRGSGKTWHLKHAVHRARQSGGIGVWFPSPSEYDSSAFLLALTETLGSEIQGRWRKKHPGRALPTDESTSRRALVSVVIALLAYPAALVAIEYVSPSSVASSSVSSSAVLHSPAVPILAAVVAGIATFIGFDFARRNFLRTTAEGRLLLEAKRVREAVRFSLKRRESLEVGAQAGQGVMGKLASREERELTERPLTLSTLIHDFRALAQEAGELVDPEPVVIAIDELDKMSDHARVRQLLRDIKGIFDIQNVYFLVSVSDEAARALNLNGLADRNEFNSSFEDVVELPRLDVTSCRDLLTKRMGADLPQLSCVLGVLSGGIPRDLVRLAENVLRRGTSEEQGRRDTVAAAIQLEAFEFRNIVVAESAGASGGGVSQAAKKHVFNLLSSATLSGETLGTVGTALEHWSPSWADQAWSEHFEEAWRRLLVRIYVAGVLARIGEQELLASAQTLQDIVAMSAQSATVAALLIKEINPQAPDVTSPNGVATRQRWLIGRVGRTAPASDGASARTFSGSVQLSWGRPSAG